MTCQAEETKNPQRDLPIGIIGSLAISTVLYVSVSLVLVGMVPYQLINIDAPLSDAFGQLGMHWAEFLIALGAIVGITSVLLVTLMGQPRILMSMARDGSVQQPRARAQAQAQLRSGMRGAKSECALGM